MQDKEKWLKENEELIEWLLDIEKNKMWGKLIIIYRAGKAIGFDISPSQRITLDKNEKMC